MTPKASKALFSTGSHHAVNLLALPWPVMSRQIGAFTTRELGPCFVQLVLIGRTLSTSKSEHYLKSYPDSVLQPEGSKRNCRAVKWQSRVINGLYFYITVITTTRMIHGTASLEARSWYLCVFLTFIEWQTDIIAFLQAFKHIFTSPSSVDKEPKATRSGNARIHGMNQVTAASIAYVATQVSLNSLCERTLAEFKFIGSVCVVIFPCIF